MTEERLTEILIEHRVCERMANGRTFVVPSALEAMKQTVNEALDEAAEKAEAYKESRFPSVHYCDCYPVVDKQSIVNLKVK